MPKVIRDDAGADLLLAEAEARLEAARRVGGRPGDSLGYRPGHARACRPVDECGRLVRRVLVAMSTAVGICVE
jgi:hypothetical protein